MYIGTYKKQNNYIISENLLYLQKKYQINET